MKKLILFSLSLMLLFSCKMYNNTVKSITLSQSPIYYDTTHYDKQNKPIPVFDTLYRVQPTWKQAYAKTSGGQKLQLWAGGGTMVTSIVAFGATASPVLIGTAFIGGIIMGNSSIGWYRWNYDQWIPKHQYDSLIKADGDLHVFWNTLPY